MSLYTLDPLRDPRWDALVRTHPAASVFHTGAWLQALHRTYGYVPTVYTTCPPPLPLTNGIVLCAVESWLTGRRLVSVPFADHCEPLVEGDEDRRALAAALGPATGRRWKYVELRPADATAWQQQPLRPSAQFWLHRLDLRDGLAALSRRMHASAIHRNVRRAEREGLRCEEGRSDGLLRDFYGLMVITRRRHNVPPPPIAWFANLRDTFGEALNIRVAFTGARPIGALLTLQHGAGLVYKYGGSDAQYHNLGPMPLLFWRTIEDATARNIATLDLGRSDLTNAGLIAFKEHLGGVRSPLIYFRCSERPVAARSFTVSAPSRVFSWLPKPLLVMAGRILYRHIA